MKTSCGRLLVTVLISIFLVGCKKDTTSVCETVEYIDLEIPQIYQPMVMEDKVEDRFLIINSRAELEQSFSFRGHSQNIGCEEAETRIEEIDFSSYTLLLGKKVVQGVVPSLKSQSLHKICGSNDLRYTLEVINGGYTALGVYVFAILINKLPGSSAVHFDITVSNE